MFPTEETELEQKVDLHSKEKRQPTKTTPILHIKNPPHKQNPPYCGKSNRISFEKVTKKTKHHAKIFHQTVMYQRESPIKDSKNEIQR